MKDGGADWPMARRGMSSRSEVDWSFLLLVCTFQSLGELLKLPAFKYSR